MDALSADDLQSRTEELDHVYITAIEHDSEEAVTLDARVGDIPPGVEGAILIAGGEFERDSDHRDNNMLKITPEDENYSLSITPYPELAVRNHAFLSFRLGFDQDEVATESKEAIETELDMSVGDVRLIGVMDILKTKLFG